MRQQYETVIGLEVHVELSTQTKLFCGCSTAFGGRPNSHTCPVCTGMPGSLPVLNKRAVDYAIAVGLATNCTITGTNHFDRKNYFYPDNPQNYQISQLYAPICQNGAIEIESEDGQSRSIRIHEIHLEEDAGKLIHQEDEGMTLVDYNRAGVPLIEIVSEPDLRSAEETISYLKSLRLILRYLGVSDCKMQEGSMRADVNLSVRRKGDLQYGTRTEMKNISSYRGVCHAIEKESLRQIELLERGQTVLQETRRWDEERMASYSMRSKEDTKDYRYFPEPDLPPLVIDENWIDGIRKQQPELPAQKRKRYPVQYQLSAGDTDRIIESKKIADIFERTVALCRRPEAVAGWLLSETMRLLKEQEKEPEELELSPENLAELIQMKEEGLINSPTAKRIFERIFEENISPRSYAKKEGLLMVSDDAAIRAAAGKAIKSNPQAVADYQNGKKKAFGFFVGQIMKEMQGKADPRSVQRILEELLKKG